MCESGSAQFHLEVRSLTPDSASGNLRARLKSFPEAFTSADSLQAMVRYFHGLYRQTASSSSARLYLCSSRPIHKNGSFYPNQSHLPVQILPT